MSERAQLRLGVVPQRVRLREAGMATAELAVSLPALLLVLGLALGAVSAANRQLRCAEAAAVAARAVARGDGPEQARASAAGHLPDGAVLTIASSGAGRARVTVTSAPRWLGLVNAPGCHAQVEATLEAGPPAGAGQP